MFPELLEHMLSVFVMEGYIILGVDPHVVHIYLKPLLWEHICEDVIHERLEMGGALQNLKNMMVGSKSSMGVMKAAFH